MSLFPFPWFSYGFTSFVLLVPNHSVQLSHLVFPTTGVFRPPSAQRMPFVLREKTDDQKLRRAWYMSS